MIQKHCFAAAAALSLCGCATIADRPAQRVGEATLLFANGLPAATAQLLDNGNTISLAIGGMAMEPGEHGLHLHTTGQCLGPDFTSAGGHLNPGNRAHGSLAPSGSHLGDLPNLVVSANGTGSAQFDLPGSPRSVLADIFDADGTAIVVHADADDYRSDPAGNAGARIACGVVKPVD